MNGSPRIHTQDKSWETVLTVASVVLWCDSQHWPGPESPRLTLASFNAVSQRLQGSLTVEAKHRDRGLNYDVLDAWMGSNLGVLLLNKLLLSYWSFKQPVLLTFLHMASSVLFIWGLRAVKLLTIQRLQSAQQVAKVFLLSLVFALAVLCANVSLKFLEVSMNQAIGAATPVFAAIFAFMLQGERESMTTYSTLLLVVGGVIVASGVEPNLNVFGALICFLGAAFRGLRAVMQAMLLKPEEKLDSMSCLAYMAPVSSILMFLLCVTLEPASLLYLPSLPFQGTALVSVLMLNCVAAFASNYFNMVVTKRTSALTIQVLGQCKGVISAVVSVLCFHNVVPVLGWCGYSVTVMGCFMYGRCKTHARKMKLLMKSSMSELRRPDLEAGYLDYGRNVQLNGTRQKLFLDWRSFFLKGAFDVAARGKIDSITNCQSGNISPPEGVQHGGGGMKRSGTCSSLLGSTIGAGHATGSSGSPSEHMMSPSGSPMDAATSGTLQIQVAAPC